MLTKILDEIYCTETRVASWTKFANTAKSYNVLYPTMVTTDANLFCYIYKMINKQDAKYTE